MMKKRNPLATLASAACLAALAPALHAQPAMDGMKGAHTAPAVAVAVAPQLTDGEVRKIDLEAGKVTLKHGDIKNLDMPGMTMVFVVKDKAMLGQLKTGDKIRFKAINDAGKFTVTEIQPVR